MRVKRVEEIMADGNTGVMVSCQWLNGSVGVLDFQADPT